jgi:hypothetical protein
VNAVLSRRLAGRELLRDTGPPNQRSTQSPNAANPRKQGWRSTAHAYTVLPDGRGVTISYCAICR